jgi:beta-aspartyl-peptidase (threonine type)
MAVFACAAWLAGSAAPARADSDADVIVRQLVASTEEWNHGDLEGFVAPYAANSTFMTPTGPVGRDAMVARYRDRYFSQGRPQQTLHFEQLDVGMLGSDHALMTGRFVLAGGGLPEQSGRFTLIWVRLPEGWRILHDHTS